MEKQVCIFDNHHVVLCVCAALFDVFNVEFESKKHIKYKDQKMEDITNAVLHVRVLLALNKSVRKILQNAFDKREGYQHVFHYFTMRNIVNANIFPNSRIYIITCFSALNRTYLQMPKTTFDMMEEMKATCCQYYDGEIPPHLRTRSTFRVRIKETGFQAPAFCKMSFSWQSCVFAPNQALKDKVKEVCVVRDSQIHDMYKKFKAKDVQKLKKRKSLNDLLHDWSEKKMKGK